MNQSYWRTSVTNVIVFSGLSRFGLEAISAEQFSDCQQVFGPGHFGGWRLIGVTTAVNIIEFLYSSVLTHAGALLHFYSCGSCFSQLGPRPLWGYWRMSRTLRFRLAMSHKYFIIFSQKRVTTGISTRSCGEARSWTCCDPERNPWNVSFNVWVWARVSARFVDKQVTICLNCCEGAESCAYIYDYMIIWLYIYSIFMYYIYVHIYLTIQSIDYWFIYHFIVVTR